MRYHSILGPISLLLLALAMPVHAYPEFHQSIVKRTGRIINCGMCHAHSDGPEGTAPGQIGSLSAADLNRLGRSRAAMDPGMAVDSPILNEFGNHIIKSIGRKKFIELKMAPEQLAEVLPAGSDMDQDGIPDAQEYRDGTHPLLSSDGRPWLLFTHNLVENGGLISVALIAALLGLYGLYRLLVGFSRYPVAIHAKKREH